MGIVQCPHCRLAVHESPELAGATVNCPTCHRLFQMPVPQAIAVVPAPVAHPEEVLRTQHVSYRRERGPQNSPGLAAVLSFFYCGLGQIYNGQMGKGLMMMVGYAFCWLLALAVFFMVSAAAARHVAVAPTALAGFLLPLLFWLWGMADAFQGAESYNRRRR